MKGALSIASHVLMLIQIELLTKQVLVIILRIAMLQVPTNWHILVHVILCQIIIIGIDEDRSL